MTLLSMDPWFDFTTYAIQVCYIVYPYLKPHINLFRDRRKQKKAKHYYALVRIYIPLSDLRVSFEEYKVNYAFLKKNFQNYRLLRCEIGKMTLFRELFCFPATQEKMLANATYPTCVKNVLESLSCIVVYLGMLCSWLLLSQTLLEDKQRAKCGEFVGGPSLTLLLPTLA